MAAMSIVWAIVLFFLASNVFQGWDTLFWVGAWIFPPLILWPILQSI